MTTQYSRYMQSVRASSAAPSDRSTPIAPLSRPLSAAAAFDQLQPRPSTRTGRGLADAPPRGPLARPASAPPAQRQVYRPAAGRAGIDRAAIDAAVAFARSRPTSRSEYRRLPVPS